MANTIVVVEGFDSESWKAQMHTLPVAGYYSDTVTGVGGVGKAWQSQPNGSSLVGLYYRAVPSGFTPTLNTTWFITSFMVMRESTTTTTQVLVQIGKTASSVYSGVANCRMGIGYEVDGRLRVITGASGVVQRNEVLLSGIGAWYHVEYRHRYGNATFGNWEVYVNGTLLASGVDDNSAAGAPVVFGFSPSGISALGSNSRVDNIVTAVSNDSTPALFGPLNVRTLIPTSTSVNQWVGSDADSVNNHLLVGDSVATSVDYVQATAGTGLYDLYGHDSVTNAPVVVQGRAAAVLDAIGTDDFSLSLRSGASTLNLRRPVGTGTATWILGDNIQTDPATGVAWTKAAFDASLFGVKS